MQTKKTTYIIPLGFLLSLFACQKRDIVAEPAKLAPVTNLKAAINGDTATLSWTLPSAGDALTVVLNDGANSRELPVPNTSMFKFGIVETNRDYLFTIKLKDAKGNTSLGEAVKFRREGAAPVKNVSGEQNENGVVLKWTTPDLPVSKITIKIGNQTADVAGNATSHQFNNVPVGSYTVSFVSYNSSNQPSNTVYLPFKVGATKVAYLGVYSDSTTLLAAGDDDEVAGAKWLFNTYPGKSNYVSFAQVKNGAVDLSQYRVIWWNYDIENGKDLPAIATDATVVTKLAQYYKDGGNLLLNQFAVQYFWSLGRLTEPYFMGFDTGGGFNNPDTWGIGVNINKKHNQSNHPLYKNIAMTTQGDGRVTFPAIGAGWKENHNAVILRIPEYLGIGGNDNEAAYNKFTGDNNLEWLGQWDGIGDYWMAGIMELKPKGEFQGSAIYIGIGAIEWRQNSGTNLYQANIEKLYKNAIDYLKTK